MPKEKQPQQSRERSQGSTHVPDAETLEDKVEFRVGRDYVNFKGDQRLGTLLFIIDQWTEALPMCNFNIEQ